MRYIGKHIIHCSDSTFGDVAEIRKWHKKRGFDDIGYHHVILRDGTIEYGRELNEIGAHTKGMNTESIGTCLIGKDNFTVEQFCSLRKLHRQLEHLFGTLEVHPHNKFNKGKTCPNFNVSDVFDNLDMK